MTDQKPTIVADPLPERNVPAPGDDKHVIHVCEHCDKSIGAGQGIDYEYEITGTHRYLHRWCAENIASSRTPVSTTGHLIEIDVRNVKSYRRRLAIAFAWVRIPFDLVFRGRAVVPDR